MPEARHPARHPRHSAVACPPERTSGGAGLPVPTDDPRCKRAMLITRSPLIKPPNPPLTPHPPMTPPAQSRPCIVQPLPPRCWIVLPSCLYAPSRGRRPPPPIPLGLDEFTADSQSQPPAPSLPRYPERFAFHSIGSDADAPVT